MQMFSIKFSFLGFGEKLIEANPVTNFLSIVSV